MRTNVLLLCKCSQSRELIFHACLSSQGVFRLQAPGPSAGRLAARAVGLSRVLNLVLFLAGCCLGTSQGTGCVVAGGLPWGLSLHCQRSTSKDDEDPNGSGEEQSIWVCAAR